MSKKKQIIINFLTVCLFIIFIPGCNQKTIQTKINKETIQESLSEFEEERCFSKLTDRETMELVEKFFIKDGDHYKKKNPDNNVCKEYLKFKETTSPIKKEVLPDMNFARGNNQVTIKLQDDDVLIIGGNEGNIKTVELFDIEKKKFQVITDNLNEYTNPNISVLKTPFYLNNSTIFYQGAVYDINKKQFIESKIDLIEKIEDFDKKIASKQWQNKTKLKFFKLFDNGTALFTKEYNDHKGLLLIDLLNRKQYLPIYFEHKNNDFNAFLYKNDDILILSGYDFDSAEQLKVHITIEVYNPITGKISELKKLDSNYNFNSRLNYPFDLDSHGNTCNPLFVDNDIILLPGYSNYVLYLYHYNLNTKQIVNKNSLTFCNLIYPINQNKLLLVPELRNPNSIYINKESTCLLDISKQENCKRLLYLETSYPYQKLTLLNNGSILLTGGIEHQMNKPNNLSSKKAYLLRAE